MMKRSGSGVSLMANEDDGPEVVVTATVDRRVSFSGGNDSSFHVDTYLFGVDYGAGTNNPDSFQQTTGETTKPEIAVVANALNGLKVAVDTMLEFSRLVALSNWRRSGSLEMRSAMLPISTVKP